VPPITDTLLMVKLLYTFRCALNVVWCKSSNPYLNHIRKNFENPPTIPSVDWYEHS
jgi:hypothetical protein